jgi:drug/metabolite transporter (DMT)-like permease
MKLFTLFGAMLTILCWGSYGPVLHNGQHHLHGDRLKPLICVGLAYFIVAIIIPVVILAVQGKLSGDWNAEGIQWSMAAGTAGALGALGIILALTSGGKPPIIMSLVFGFAPVTTAIISIYQAKVPFKSVSPMFLMGVLLVGIGAATVVRYTPKGAPPSPPATTESAPAEHH